MATIQAGIPGAGGDIGYGADSVWLTVFDVPLTRVQPTTNRVVKQWVGKGGDSLRFGFDSLWITDYKKGLLSRIRLKNCGRGDEWSSSLRCHFLLDAPPAGQFVVELM